MVKREELIKCISESDIQVLNIDDIIFDKSLETLIILLAEEDH